MYVNTTRRGSQFPYRAHESMTRRMPVARRKARDIIVFMPAIFGESNVVTINE